MIRVFQEIFLVFLRFSRNIYRTANKEEKWREQEDNSRAGRHWNRLTGSGLAV